MSTYGYSVYDVGYLWQGKLYPTAKPNLYGFQPYQQFDVSPFTATARDYTTIMLKWQQPLSGTVFGFRLVANRYGFPVDQNDGDLLIDATQFPGTAYADQQVVPGTYHYYAIYIKVAQMPDVWQRCAFAVVLAPVNNKLGNRLFNLLPPYFRELQNGELTQDAAGNVYLEQYLDVIGWGADYLKTQYDILFEHLNDPMFIPLGDLVNLAGQLGMPFQPEVPAYIMRKALANWTHVCQLRGTPGGLSENITLLTGYPVDLQSGRNLMLEDDQAGPFHPRAQTWNSHISYALNELVIFGNFVYKCIQATTNLGNAPTGTSSANTWWTAQQNVTDPASALANPATVGGVNTWQVLYPSLDAGGAQTIPAGSLVGTIGLVDPLNGASFTHNAFSVFNKAGSTQDVMIRSVSQIASDRTGSNTNMTPDPLQAAKDGIPVPRIDTATNAWVPGTRYATNDIVLFDGMLFQALRASRNATPPLPYSPINANPYFETAVTPWTGHSNATIAQSAAQFFQATHSMSITPDGTTALPGAASEAIAVIPNSLIALTAWVFVTAGYNGAQLAVTWLDPFGQAISTTTTSTVNVPAATWTLVSLNATVPANAATAKVFPQLSGTPANTVVSFWDAVVFACVQTPEWAALSRDERLRLMMSGYLDGPAGTGVQVVPFVEWYDESGRPIISNGLARVTARTATPGTAASPPNLVYDSFNLGQNTFLNGRTTDTRDQNWLVKTGVFTVSAFNNGSAYPAAAGTRSFAVLTGLSGTSGANIWLGVTFASSPQAGQTNGIVFRATDTSNYWRAGMTGLHKVTSGTSSLVGNYSTACQPGDRLTILLNGNNITVFRNGAQVLTTTDSYLATNTLHGITVEAT